jgi:3(or 17)beta-hydroxysteroid dehydrogenase
MPRLSGKVCVVTGAARGIGRAISHAFLTEGATVIMTDKDEPAGTQAAAELGCRFERLDVAEERDWLRLAERVPTADVVVNNAGVTGFEDALR